MTQNIIYFGSPEFSAEILEDLIAANHHIVAVVTTKDKPLGRKQILTPSPVALLANKHNLPTFKPDILDNNLLAHLKLFKPDLFLVVSFGKIIPAEYLSLPPLGTFNIHFSLLPKYRGALCISEPIKNGDNETGVTLMKMDEKLDHGPLIKSEKIAIDPDDNTATLTTKLTQLAKEILHRTLPEIYAQKIHLTPQDESLVSFTPSHKTRTRQNAFIPPPLIQKALNGQNSLKIHNTIRSLNPDPGAWTVDGDQEVKIIKTSFSGNHLSLDIVMPSGKNQMPIKQYLAGRPNSVFAKN